MFTSHSQAVGFVLPGAVTAGGDPFGQRGIEVDVLPVCQLGWDRTGAGLGVPPEIAADRINLEKKYSVLMAADPKAAARMDQLIGITDDYVRKGFLRRSIFKPAPGETVSDRENVTRS